MAKKKKTVCKRSTKKNKLSADDALKLLKEGNKRFLGHDPINYPTEAERGGYGSGQQPYAAVLCCADSRVSPEIMFNAGLDELFVVRVAGNVATTEALASIEYAVLALNTNLIVVVGHECCGAVKAAIDNAKSGKPNSGGDNCNLDALLLHITPAILAARGKKAYKEDAVDATVRENAKLVAKELRDRSPIIAKNCDVKIVSAYYHLISGKVDFSRPQ